MDMTKYTTADKGEWKLKKHTEAIRENQLTVAYIIFSLHGYKFTLEKTDAPLASFARECLSELDHKDQIGLWSCSTRDGGMWTPKQRAMLKTGEV